MSWGVAMLGGGGLHTGRRAAAAWLDTAEAYVRIPQCPAPVPGGPRRGADTRDTAVGSLGGHVSRGSVQNSVASGNANI